MLSGLQTVDPKQSVQACRKGSSTKAWVAAPLSEAVSLQFKSRVKVSIRRCRPELDIHRSSFILEVQPCTQSPLEFMIKLILTLLVATLTPISSFAWKAMSTASYPIHIVYISDEHGDEATAMEQAMSRCKAFAINGGSCKPLARPYSAEVAVVMHGEAGLSVGYGKDPEKARNAARDECRRLSRSCIPLTADGSKEVRYAAIAHSPTAGLFSHTGALSQEDANKKVLAFCEGRTQGPCKLANLRNMGARGTYAVAVTADGKHEYIVRNGNSEIAQNEAIKNCELENKQACAASEKFRPVFNGWNDPFSKAQWSDIDAIRDEGTRNWHALLEKFKLANRSKAGSPAQSEPSTREVSKPDMGPCMETRVYRGHEADVIRSPGCY